VILAKAALALAGLPGGPVRPPLVDATPAEVARLRDDLAAGTLDVPVSASQGSAITPKTPSA
jgi:4-hydroxy-tetrahydrodipicolinate synthase